MNDAADLAHGQHAGASLTALAQIRELEKARRWLEAKDVYETLLAEPGDHIDLAAGYGKVLYKAHRYEEALKPLSDAVLANPADQKSARRLAEVVRMWKPGPGVAGSADAAAKSPAVSDETIPGADKADDPLGILLALAKRVDDERVSGRLARSSYGFADFSYPDIDYGSHPGYGAAADIMSRDPGDVIRPLYRAVASMWNGYVATKSTVRSFPVPSAHTVSFDRLERDGILVLKMSELERAELMRSTEEVAQAVRAKRARRPAHTRGVESSSGSLYHVKSNPTDFIEFLTRLFDNHGIRAMASAYQGVPMSIKLANLQINSVEDSSIVGSSLVGDLPLSAGYYMHIDSDFGVMKVIIYRTRVTAEMGAFRYVPGSNRIGMTPFELCLRKATDKSNYDSCRVEDRRRFAHLPAFLQKKANFGNDLIAGDPQLDALLEREATMAGDAGDMVFFDNNGIHRGAIFEHGEREIIQVLLSPP